VRGRVVGRAGIGIFRASRRGGLARALTLLQSIDAAREFLHAAAENENLRRELFVLVLRKAERLFEPLEALVAGIGCG
jgi:hypothetical protein